MADLKKMLKSTDIDKVIKLFKQPVLEISKEDAAGQYDVFEHQVFNKTYRPDKIIDKDTGRKNETGEPITQRATIAVDRIGLPLQNYIVEQRIGFMLSIPVKNNMRCIDDSVENEKCVKLIKFTEKIQRDNRMYFRNKDVLRRQMSEMQCAELWYLVKNPEGVSPNFTMKCKILSPELGDKLCPMYDNFGDMIAFGRGYSVMVDGKSVEYFDIYTKDFDYKYSKRSGKWVLRRIKTDKNKVLPNPTPNPVGKIMVIYYEQKAPEWHKVQSLIERLEDSVSNHGDMNDYFGSPILAVSGEVIGFVQKGEQGKILELDQDARANYLALNTPPESILKEQQNLRENIYSLTSTADISFEKVKGIGNLSAVALELLFISSLMAAKSKEETFSVGLQRRINLIMEATIKVLDTSLAPAKTLIESNPEITVYVPFDINAFIETLGKAVADGIMSIPTAVILNPLISDDKAELKLLNDKPKPKPNE